MTRVWGIASKDREDIETVLWNFGELWRRIRNQITRLTERLAQRD
ncbi:MAG: hypothetical protein Q8R07_01095 [Candidatus Uhrbacteria bacterium]|nr:hypothetical protein [Candidatus Uhrbacteria bacterium]